MKFFNTAGPVNRPNHYKIDPLHRWSLDDVLGLIAQEKSFIGVRLCVRAGIRVRAAFPSGSAPTGPVRWQKIVLELKVIGAAQSYATVKAQAQTAAYALACNAEEAHILIFDRDETRGWREKVFDDEGEHGGVRMKIWGL